jgi:superfamily I DNA/RNA helicase
LLAIISDMPRGSSLDNLECKINDMFFDSEKQFKPTLTLSSIHKSKGREWDRVYWYGKSAFQPSKYARKDWQLGQEKNLMYVAATRSKNVLVQVAVNNKPGPIVFRMPEVAA